MSSDVKRAPAAYATTHDATVTRYGILNVLFSFFLTLLTACSRPSLEVLAPPAQIGAMAQISGCMTTYGGCLTLRTKLRDICMNLRNSDPDLGEVILFGKGGIMCADEQRAIDQCQPEMEECFRRSGALLSEIKPERQPTKPVDFEKVRTPGKYLFVFERGLTIPLPHYYDTLNLFFARKVLRVESAVPFDSSNNEVTIRGRKAEGIGGTHTLEVTLDDNSTCTFELQRNSGELHRGYDFTFDCIGQPSGPPSLPQTPLRP
jgi:hypothetical protein